MDIGNSETVLDVKEKSRKERKRGVVVINKMYFCISEDASGYVYDDLVALLIC